MSVEELVQLLRVYLEESDKYEKELEQAIENNNREFGYSGAGDDRQEAYQELEQALNDYIDNRIALYLAKMGKRK